MSGCTKDDMMNTMMEDMQHGMSMMKHKMKSILEDMKRSPKKDFMKAMMQDKKMMKLVAMDMKEEMDKTLLEPAAGMAPAHGWEPWQGYCDGWCSSQWQCDWCSSDAQCEMYPLCKSCSTCANKEDRKKIFMS